jgi:hypothetical protein
MRCKSRSPGRRAFGPLESCDTTRQWGWWNYQGHFATVRTLLAAWEGQDLCYRMLELQPRWCAAPGGRIPCCWVLEILLVGFWSYVCGGDSAVWNIGGAVCLPGSSIVLTHASCAHASPYTYLKPILFFPARIYHWSLNNCYCTYNSIRKFRLDSFLKTASLVLLELRRTCMFLYMLSKTNRERGRRDGVIANNPQRVWPHTHTVLIYFSFCSDSNNAKLLQSLKDKWR